MKLIFSNAKDILNDPEIKALFEKFSPNAGGHSEAPFGEVFRDPIASQTAWSQLSNSNLKFRSRKLITIDSHQVSVKPTPRTIGLILLFLVVLLLPTLHHVTSSSSFDSASHLPKVVVMARAGVSLAMGGIFVFIAGLVAYSTRPLLITTVFDKKHGRFSNVWEGNRPRLMPSARAGLLTDIHALQLLGEYLPRRRRYHSSPRGGRTSSVSGGFYRYELNIVLNDATRLHIMAHGDEKSLKKDAESLAFFLGKPLWTVTPKTVQTSFTE